MSIIEVSRMSQYHKSFFFGYNSKEIETNKQKEKRKEKKRETKVS